MAINTTTALGFIKKNFDNVLAAKAAATAGKIVFDSAHNIICVGGEVYGGNVQDADFTNSVLTITKGDGTNITINFSDVASASAMMDVFGQIEDAMGITSLGSSFAPDYSDTEYLTSATNLVAADKALDTAIQGVDTKIGTSIAALDGSAGIASVNNDIVTIKAGITETDGVIANSGASDITLAKVAKTGDAEDVAYNNSGSGTIVTADNVQDAIQQIEVALDQAIGGGVTNVKINGGTIVNNHEADIAVDGAYNASSNKIATQTTVTNAIDALDVTEYAQAEIDTTVSNQTTFKVKGISETNGAIAAGTNTTDLVIDGSYNASTNKIATKSTVDGAISTAVQALDGSATIASKSGNVVTIKTGVTETDGVIDNDSGTDIVLEEVAVTGAAADVSILDSDNHYTATDVEGALAEVASAVEALQGAFDVIVSTNAATTPQGVVWGDPAVTGTLAASADTFHKIYLVPATGGASLNSYSEYITTKSTSGSTTTYSWEKLGDVAVNLTGYVKSITVNGKSYEVTSGSTNIALGNVITAVTGETAISGGNSDFVAVTATPTTDSTTGTNSIAITSNVKTQAVSTASSSAMGLAEASDVKSYVDTKSAVVNSNPTIVVNDSSAATIGTVGGNALTAKVALYWDEWETA